VSRTEYQREWSRKKRENIEFRLRKAELQRKYYYSNPNMNSKSFLYRLKTRYGLTGEQYEDLFQRQHGCCAICLRPSTEFKNKLAVDHDHVSGHIRGLLCNNCNRRVVGRHRREGNAEILLAAYDYLFREYPGWVVPPKIKRKRRKKHVRKIKKNI